MSDFGFRMQDYGGLGACSPRKVIRCSESASETILGQKRSHSMYKKKCANLTQKVC